MQKNVFMYSFAIRFFIKNTKYSDKTDLEPLYIDKNIIFRYSVDKTKKCIIFINENNNQGGQQCQQKT